MRPPDEERGKQHQDHDAKDADGSPRGDHVDDVDRRDAEWDLGEEDG